MATATEPAHTTARPPNRKIGSYPFYAPRFWHGMRFGPWLALLARHRFRIHPLRITMAVIITVFSVMNSALYWLQRLIYGRRIEDTELTAPPIFILGHWRSGTTLLHELLVLDERFSYPNTYECFEPNHFLLSGSVLPVLLKPLLPRKRPMDNMLQGWHQPQEDEFALLALGLPTPYLTCGFPNQPPEADDFLDMEGIPAERLAHWKAGMIWFLKTLTFQKGKRLVLKSPPHTGRVQVLAEMFPGAKFIHIVREPLSVFASTKRLWQALDTSQGLQHPAHNDLDERVFAGLERMYRGFERQRAALLPGSVCDVRYEDLVRDPVGELRRVFDYLQIDGFEPIGRRIEAYFESKKDYQKNEHRIEPALAAEIARRWGPIMARYGYVSQ